MRRYLLAFLFLLLHTALVIDISWTVWVENSADPAAGEAWLFLLVVDFPSSMVMPFVSGFVESAERVFFLCGGVQWFFIGFCLQRLFARRRRPTTRTVA